MRRCLDRDCLVGAWIRDIAPTRGPDGRVRVTNPDQAILLSAGDLDEAVQTAVLLADGTGAGSVGNGTAYARIDAFRSGVLGGLPACEPRLG